MSHIIDVEQPKMNADLSELHERLNFCRTTVSELEAKIAQLTASSISVWTVPWTQPGAGEIRVKLLSHPPVSLRQQVGKIVNEQRSILDALVGILAVRNGANLTSDIYFPVVKEKARFFEKDARSKIRKLSVADQMAIESFNPWCPPVDDQEDGNLDLFQLHESDKVRKHRNLLRWACQGGINPFASGPIGFIRSGSIIFRDIGKEVNIASFLGVAGEVGVNFRLVYLEPPILMGCSVSSCLSSFNTAVDRIVSHFN